MAQVSLIINPRAGQGRTARTLPALRAFAAQQQMSFLLTSREGDGYRLARHAVATGSQVVIAAGGDGTVHEVLNGIFAAAAGGAPPSTLGIIPLGSANDFASGLGLPQRLDQVLARLVCGKRRRCDVGLVQSHGRPARYFAFSLGLGALGAAAAERRQVRLLRGRLLYLYAAARARPLRATPQIIRVRYDAQPIQEQRISFLSVNNVGSVGGFDFAPQAKLDDGLLDIVLFRGASFRRRLRLLSLMCIGRHRPARDFQFARTARLEVWSGGQLPLHLDGEPYGASFQAPAALRISVMPQALKVIV